jgi:hypothetical protein
MIERALARLVLALSVCTGVVLAQGSDAIQPLHVFQLDENDAVSIARNRALIASVGDSADGSFVPQLDISAWDGECGMSIDLAATAVTPILNERSVGDVTVSLVGATVRQDIFARNGTGLEWTIELSETPKSNRFSFPFESRGLSFYFQDSLTDFERDSLGCRRPDSVAGSYAVYRFSTAAKAFHIYRPRAWDSNSDTVWCDLEIDTLANELTLIIPPDFLERAAFPVLIDPTFGSTSEGASGFYMASSHVRHCRFTMGGQAGTLDSITCFGHYDGVTDSLGTAIYTDGGGYPDALLATCGGRLLSNDWSTQWYSFPVAGSPSLQASTDYWLSVFMSGGGYLQYDDLGTGTSDGHFNDPWPPTDPASRGWNPLDYTFSIYATYTLSGGEQPINRRLRIEGEK